MEPALASENLRRDTLYHQFLQVRIVRYLLIRIFVTILKELYYLHILWTSLLAISRDSFNSVICYLELTDKEF